MRGSNLPAPDWSNVVACNAVMAHVEQALMPPRRPAGGAKSPNRSFCT
jgi:hypothetical protein